MARAKLDQLHKHSIEAIGRDKRKNVYTNGADDNYPERIELIINNSVTAKMASNKMASFIVGKGFKNQELNNRVLNKKKDLTAYAILKMIANSIVKQKASALHVNYNGALEVDSLDVLPYKNCRLEKLDDVGNKGKWFYSNSWGDLGFSFNRRNEKAIWFYPYSRSEEVIKAQFKAEQINPLEDKVNNFRGHLLLMNLEPENIYPLSFIDPAYNDADSEFHSSLFRNNSIKNGFVDKQIIVAKEGTDENPNTIEQTIYDMHGTGGSNIGLTLVDSALEDVSKEIQVINLGATIDAERFKYFDDENEIKILQCFENIHPSLVLGNDTSLFGDGGKKLSELKLNYSQDVEYIRKEIEQTLMRLYPKTDWSIEPLINESIYNTTQVNG